MLRRARILSVLMTVVLAIAGCARASSAGQGASHDGGKSVSSARNPSVREPVYLTVPLPSNSVLYDMTVCFPRDRTAGDRTTLNRDMLTSVQISPFPPPGQLLKLPRGRVRATVTGDCVTANGLRSASVKHPYSAYGLIQLVWSSGGLEMVVYDSAAHPTSYRLIDLRTRSVVEQAFFGPPYHTWRIKPGEWYMLSMMIFTPSAQIRETELLRFEKSS
jgi:hypothetical protein